MDKNKKLQEFWNQVFLMDENTKKEIKENIKEDDYIHLVPSEKLLNAVKALSKSKNVLDYGCGNGWASIILAKNGCSQVTSVDTSINSIDSLKFYASIFNTKNINAFSIDFNWLSKEDESKYDGLICSNVLDVVDEDTSNMIIKELNRVLKKHSKAIIGLNYYLTSEKIKEKNLKLENGKELYIDGVLRLLNKSDEEWQEELKKYFKIIKLEYFAWPNESKETRRLFYLEK